MSDNKNPTLSLMFEARDIPWLFHAFTIQSNTCLCYGAEAKKIRERIKVYIDQIRQFFPTLAKYEIEEFAFFNAVAALANSKTWSLYQEKPHYAWEEKSWWRPCVLVCDGLIFEITRDDRYNETFVRELIDILQAIAPIDSTYIEHESFRRQILPFL